MTFRPLLTTPYPEQHPPQGRPVAEAEQALADTGIVAQPIVRRANMDALVALSASQVAALTVDLTRKFDADHVPLRDIGEAVGVSFQRVHQLLRA